MSDIQKKVSEDIAKEMIGDRKFCVGIVDCQSRAEVRELLASKGIDASDSDIDHLAKNISEIADICRKLDENELNHIAGGIKDLKDIDRYDVLDGAIFGVGVLAAVTGGVGILSLVAASIKRAGDKASWWNKDKHKR